MSWEHDRDKWLTTTPEDQGHDEGCNCVVCHEYHDLLENLDDINYPCCTDRVDFLISIGRWCSNKPKEHDESYMRDGICLDCKAESEANEETATTPLPTTAPPTSVGFLGRFARAVKRILKMGSGT